MRSLSLLLRGAQFAIKEELRVLLGFSWNLLLKYKALPPVNLERLNHNTGGAADTSLRPPSNTSTDI